MSGHGRTVCSCGALISQCRCPADHVVLVIQKGCDRCKGLLAPATQKNFSRGTECRTYPAEVDDI